MPAFAYEFRTYAPLDLAQQGLLPLELAGEVVEVEQIQDRGLGGHLLTCDCVCKWYDVVYLYYALTDSWDHIPTPNTHARTRRMSCVNSASMAWKRACSAGSCALRSAEPAKMPSRYTQLCV